MRQMNGKRLPRDLEQIAERLREERPEASPLDLDRIKTMAIRRAAESAPRKGHLMKSRLVSVLVAAGILVGGAGGVMAATGGVPGSGHSSDSSSKDQYGGGGGGGGGECPPASQHGQGGEHGHGHGNGDDNGKHCGQQ
jgi:hypothetical protein